MQHPELAAELVEVHPGVGLARMRAKAGLDLRSVAAQAGCSPSTISRIERQLIHNPDDGLVWKIANAIGYLRSRSAA
jgi:transcriptional regulator with XRE-family HTH domain